MYAYACTHQPGIVSMISRTEALILSLLIERRTDGAFGSELMHLSGGRLKRGSVYTTLTRMEAAGLVKANEVLASDELALPRTVYRITGKGIAARSAFGAWTGLVPHGV